MTKQELQAFHRISTRLDKLFKTLDRIEDKLDDLHDHFMIIVDGVFESSEEELVMEKTSSGKKRIKKNVVGKIYNA